MDSVLLCESALEFLFLFLFFFSSFTVKASWVGERVLYDRDGAALQT